MSAASMAFALLLPLLLGPDVTAQPVDPTAGPAPLARGYHTRALAGGWGHSWLHGWPGYGKAISDIEYVSFYPQMGWFVTNWLELYGEGTVHVYYRPHAAVLGGVVGIGGRHHFLNRLGAVTVPKAEGRMSASHWADLFGCSHVLALLHSSGYLLPYLCEGTECIARVLHRRG